MINLDVQVYYDVTTILKSNAASVNDLIVEVFETDEGFYGKFVEKIKDVYSNEDFLAWLSEQSAKQYIRNVSIEKATIHESDDDYVMIRVPFEFDEKMAYNDYVKASN